MFSKRIVISNLSGLIAVLLGLAVTEHVHAQQETQKRFEQLDGNRDGKTVKEEATRGALRGRLKNAISGALGRNNSNDEAIPAEPSKALEAPVRQGPKLLTPGEHGIGRFVPDFEFSDIEGYRRNCMATPITNSR